LVPGLHEENGRKPDQDREEYRKPVAGRRRRGGILDCFYLKATRGFKEDRGQIAS